MSDLRSKLERTAEETIPPVPIPQDRRRSGSHAGEAASVRFTRDRGIGGLEIPQKTKAELDINWHLAEHKRRERERKESDARETAERTARYDTTVARNKVIEERNRKIQNEKALAEFEENQILATLADASTEESKAVGLLIQSKYFASREPSIWQMALDEVRQKSRAYKNFSQIPMPEIDEMSDTELAKRLGCDVTLAAALRKGFYIGY
jgi:hypothetical protein